MRNQIDDKDICLRTVYAIFLKLVFKLCLALSILELKLQRLAFLVVELQLNLFFYYCVKIFFAQKQISKQDTFTKALQRTHY